MGKRQTPDHMKLMKGTDQACRMSGNAAVEGQVVEGYPEAPDWLSSPHAIDEWHRVTPLLVGVKVLTEKDLSYLGHYCNIHGELIDAAGSRTPPTASMYNALDKFAGKMGMTPADRAKVSAASEAKPSNPFTEHRGK